MENNCCENKEKMCPCDKDCSNKNQCCMTWKKCHMIKKLLVVIIILISFCLGTQFGELKAEKRGFDGYRMMDFR